jgi:soluble lytic murein transglycosylase-like protein
MPPTTPTRAALISLARAAAAAHSLDAALVCAVCEQESSWSPWAIRYEPPFFTRYIAPMLTAGNSPATKLSATEACARAFSWGLMQVMGQVAREQNFVGPSFAELCDPQIGLEIGCRVLESKLRATHGDVPRALQLWNGGANPNYASEVLARAAQYK